LLRVSISLTITSMSYRVEYEPSRRVIDVATGILVALRGCSDKEAFDELVRVVNQTGIGIGSLAAGLVALASGSSSADHVEAFTVWGESLRRGRLVSIARS
jgi:ANTAR domain